MSSGPTSTDKTAPPGRPAAQKRKAVLRTASAHWLALILGIIAVVFIAQNRHEVSIDFFWANLTSPMWLVLLITAVVGVAIGVLESRRRRPK